MIWSSKINALVMDAHVVRTVSCTWTARTALHPFGKKDHGIPKSLSRKVSKRQRRQKIRWNLSSVGSQKRLLGKCVFFFLRFLHPALLFFPFWCWKEQLLENTHGTTSFWIKLQVDIVLNTLQRTDRTYSGRLYLILLVEMLPCLCKTYLSPFCQIIFVGIQVKYT